MNPLWKGEVADQKKGFSDGARPSKRGKTSRYLQLEWSDAVQTDSGRRFDVVEQVQLLGDELRQPHAHAEQCHLQRRSANDAYSAVSRSCRQTASLLLSPLFLFRIRQIDKAVSRRPLTSTLCFWSGGVKMVDSNFAVLCALWIDHKFGYLGSSASLPFLRSAKL